MGEEVRLAGNAEIVTHNMLVGAGNDVFPLGNGTSNMFVDHNLCLPESSRLRGNYPRVLAAAHPNTLR